MGRKMVYLNSTLELYGPEATCQGHDHYYKPDQEGMATPNGISPGSVAKALAEKR
jgi:hypothetical protein